MEINPSSLKRKREEKKANERKKKNETKRKLKIPGILIPVVPLSRA